MKKVTYILASLGVLLIGGAAAGAAHAEESKVFQQSQPIQFTFRSKATVEFDTTDGLVFGVDEDGTRRTELLPGEIVTSNALGITVTTNDANGYRILATTGSASNTTTDLVRTKDSGGEAVEDTTHKFTSLGTSDSLASLTTQGTWGYRTSIGGTDYTSYSGLPVYTANGQTDAKTILTMDKTKENYANKTYFQLGAYVADGQMPGTYTTTINFYIVPGIAD